MIERLNRWACVLCVQHPYRLEVDVPRLSLIVERSGCRVALTDQSYSLVIRGIQIKSLLAKVCSHHSTCLLPAYPGP
jgi:hypothetical protein